MRSLIGLVVLTGVASAAPLGEVWRVPNACRGGLVRTATHVFSTGDDVGLAGYQVATGKRTFARRSETSIYYLGGVGNVVMMSPRDGDTVTAYNAKGRRLWRHAGANAWATPRGAVFLIEKDNTHRVLEHVDARTGKTMWTAEIAANDDVERVLATSRTVFAQSLDMLRAFDLATGKAVWSTAIERTAWLSDHGARIALHQDDMLRFLDAATGKPVTSLPKVLVIDTVTHGARTYVTEADVTGYHVTAYDRDATSNAWRLELAAAGAAVAATDDVVVMYDDSNGVQLIDAKAGTVVPHSAFGLADMAGIEVRASGPMIVACDSLDLVALDPRGTRATAEETATITGTITCPRCSPAERAKLRVRLGTTIVSPDASGHFTAKVTARGRIAPQTEVEGRLDASAMWVKPHDTKGKLLGIVTLSGKQTYDLGAIETQPRN